MSDLTTRDLYFAPVTEPITFAELMGEHKPTGWPGRVPDPQEQRTQAIIRERNRRIDAEQALRTLQKAVIAHMDAIPRKNRRKADKALYKLVSLED